MAAKWSVQYETRWSIDNAKYTEYIAKSYRQYDTVRARHGSLKINHFKACEILYCYLSGKNAFSYR